MVLLRNVTNETFMQKILMLMLENPSFEQKQPVLEIQCNNIVELLNAAMCLASSFYETPKMKLSSCSKARKMHFSSSISRSSANFYIGLERFQLTFGGFHVHMVHQAFT